MINPLSEKQLKKDFPFRKTGVAYLDNASTSQKPQSVITKISDYYTNYGANVHRGIYDMSEKASTEYEHTRKKVQQFIHAQSEKEIIFTSGTTHSLNIAARLTTQTMKKGDEIILTTTEHHSNLVSWQIVAKERGLTITELPLSSDELIDPSIFETLISQKTKILAITHMSNVTGYITPVKKLTKIAHKHNMQVVLDAAQSIPHMPVDVQDLDVDYLAFSAHKMCGPTGIGVLYGKKEFLEKAEPIFGGGSMIDEVTLTESTWAKLPLKFEPGTPNIAGVIGLGAAIDYLNNIGMEKIQKQIEKLYTYLWENFTTLENITIYGPKERTTRSGIISFTLNDIHAHDIASLLNEEDIAVRAGHHCAQPLMKLWNTPSTVRASLSFYNTTQDIDRLITGIHKAQTFFKK